MNIAVVRGRVLRDPTERELSTGRQVSIDVGVSYAEGPAETVEVVWADAPKVSALPRQGQEVFVAGRVRRRFFRMSNGATASRMELVADTVLTAGKTRQINRRLAALVADVEGGVGG
jgi:single-stranded DNA-binding protein